MDFCPGRFTPSQLHGHLGRCACHVVPKPCFGLRSDPLGHELHSLGLLGAGCFSWKVGSQPTRCLRLAEWRVHHPCRLGQGVSIRGESLTPLSNQICVDGVRLLSCWVHPEGSFQDVPQNLQPHNSNCILVLARSYTQSAGMGIALKPNLW